MKEDKFYHLNLNKFLMNYSSKGSTICGLDEAGRGAFAGPLVVSAVVLPVNFNFTKIDNKLVIRDSKNLTVKQRRLLFNAILEYSQAIAVEVFTAGDINENGINWANTEGFRRLITRINANKYIVDGNWKLGNLGDKEQMTSCVIKADEKILCALCAGIVAKIYRDVIMNKLHLKYPMYEWDKNTGHGTKAHIEAIKQFGLTEYHKVQYVKTGLKNEKKKSAANHFE